MIIIAIFVRRPVFVKCPCCILFTYIALNLTIDLDGRLDGWDLHYSFLFRLLDMYVILIMYDITVRSHMAAISLQQPAFMR